jgi:hypothetical protein
MTRHLCYLETLATLARQRAVGRQVNKGRQRVALLVCANLTAAESVRHCTVSVAQAAFEGTVAVACDCMRGEQAALYGTNVKAIACACMWDGEAREM